MKLISRNRSTIHVITRCQVLSFDSKMAKGKT